MHYFTDLSGHSVAAPVKSRFRAWIGAAILILVLPSMLWAAQVTLAWDPNHAAPDGYRLYQRTQGQSYDLTQPIWSGSTTTCTIHDLADATRYFFVVRAYAGSTESGNSNEVSYTTPAPAEPPVAQAGASQTVSAASTVRLDGGGSFDPEGRPLTYQWVQTAGPAVTLLAADVVRPSFTAPTEGNGQNVTLVFELTVTNDRGLSGSDTCMIHVTPVQSEPDDQPPPGDPAPDPSNPDTEPPGSDTDPPDGTDDQGDDTPPAPQPERMPVQPIIYYPAEGATGISLTPRLTASEFIGGDAKDTHTFSQWRIRNGQNQRIVLDAVRDHRSLTTLWVPYFTLAPGTAYACQVRYFDNHGQASEWSYPVTFTTGTSWWFSRRSFSLAQSLQVPAEADRNDMADNQATETIKSVETADGQHTMSVRIEHSTGATRIDGAAAVAPDTLEPPPPLTDLHPYGVLAYRIEVEQPGQETSVTIHLSSPIDPRSAWIAYGADGEWVDCSDHVTVSADGLTVVRTITDGGRDDADGTANGAIVDILSPLQISAESDGSPDKGLGDTGTQGSPGAGGGSCFIETLLK